MQWRSAVCTLLLKNILTTLCYIPKYCFAAALLFIYFFFLNIVALYDINKCIHILGFSKYLKTYNVLYFPSFLKIHSKIEDCTKLASVLPFSWLENSLLALETVLPMSARERRLDFLVWWRCLRSNVYITLFLRLALSWPISIWLSVICSERKEKQGRQTLTFCTT